MGPERGLERVSREHVGVVVVVDALVVLVRPRHVQELVALLGRLIIRPRKQEARALVDDLRATFEEQRRIAGNAAVFAKRERDVAADVDLLVSEKRARGATRE